MTNNFKIIEGHVLTVLKSLPDEYIHTIVTSPPYFHLRTYGTEPRVWGGNPDCIHEWGSWEEVHDEREPVTVGKSRTTDRSWGGDRARKFDGNHQKHTAGASCVRCGAWLGELGQEPSPKLYVAHLVEVFREIRRVLRGDGTCWLNLGDGYAHPTTGGNGTTGGRDQSTLQSSMPPVGATPSRKPMPSGLKEKDLLGMPWRVAFALQADGWWLRSDIVWCKPNPLPESVRDRPTRAHEYVFLLTKSKGYWYDQDAERLPYRYIGKGFVREGSKRGHPIVPGQGYGTHRSERSDDAYAHGGANLRDVWTFATRPFAGAHFAPFPVDLVARMIRLGCPPRACPTCGSPWRREVRRLRTLDGVAREDLGSWRSDDDARGGPNGQKVGHWRFGTLTRHMGWHSGCGCGVSGERSWVPGVVLDPFVGAGTTLLAARLLGRRAVGIELNPEYVEMARQRVEGGLRAGWGPPTEGIGGAVSGLVQETLPIPSAITPT